MQESKKPIIQSIRDYVMLNPDIDDRKINIDYLGNGIPLIRSERILSTRDTQMGPA